MVDAQELYILVLVLTDSTLNSLSEVKIKKRFVCIMQYLKLNNYKLDSKKVVKFYTKKEQDSDLSFKTPELKCKKKDKSLSKENSWNFNSGLLI